jgi:hypothetical protein
LNDRYYAVAQRDSPLLAGDDETICGYCCDDEGQGVNIATRIDFTALSGAFQGDTNRCGAGLMKSVKNCSVVLSVTSPLR